MYKPFIYVLIALGLCLGSASCTKEAREITPPQGYTSMHEVFIQDKQFKRAWIFEHTVNVILEDDTILSLESEDAIIEDCRTTPARTVTVSRDGTIMVGETDTGIRQDTSLPDDKAAPVYIWFDDKSLSMTLRNGNTLTIANNKKIPVIHLFTKDKASIESKEEYVEGSITISDRTGLYPEMDGFTAPMKIRGRGNSTWSMPKKPWKIKLDEKTRMFGMSKDKEWCLLADYTDKSLMRNKIAMQLSEICGLSWTPKMISVDVWLNDHYQGVYTFSEHKKVSAERVNIDTEQGDMYFEMEQYPDQPVHWNTSIYKIPLMFDEPENPDAATISRGKKVFADFEEALAGEDFADSEKGYAAHIDVESFINYYIVEELVKNIDGNLRKSTFVTKTPNGKLEMYHVWDFDIALGNNNRFSDEVGIPFPNGYTGWYIRDFSLAGPYTGWYYKLFQDSVFTAKVIDRWNQLYPVFKTRIPEFIENEYDLVKPSADDNFEKWDILSTFVWWNVVATGSYRGEVDYVKNFFIDRLEWMNTEYKEMTNN